MSTPISADELAARDAADRAVLALAPTGCAPTEAQRVAALEAVVVQQAAELLTLRECVREMVARVDTLVVQGQIMARTRVVLA